MNLSIRFGDVLEADAEALVLAIDGAAHGMEGGVARQCGRRWPELWSEIESEVRHPVPLGKVYELLQRYPGEDLFSIYVENGSEGRVQLDFPNDTTRHCVELEQELRILLGAGMVRVEPMQESD